MEGGGRGPHEPPLGTPMESEGRGPHDPPLGTPMESGRKGSREPPLGAHVEGDGRRHHDGPMGHGFPHLAVDGYPSENIKLESGSPSPRPGILISSV